MMKPIIFSTSMVKAILDGKKTQTRRVLRRQPDDQDGNMILIDGRWKYDYTVVDEYCPYGGVGDNLWVRETWATEKRIDKFSPSYIGNAGVVPIFYQATDNNGFLECGKWRPSIFMPRWASRITLEITAVRVERLQEITDSDAIQEGVIFMGGMADNWDEAPWCASLIDQEPMKYPRMAYARLWDSLNGKKYPYESNPWVWVVSLTP